MCTHSYPIYILLIRLVISLLHMADEATGNMSFFRKKIVNIYNFLAYSDKKRNILDFFAKFLCDSTSNFFSYLYYLCVSSSWIHTAVNTHTWLIWSQLEQRRVSVLNLCCTVKKKEYFVTWLEGRERGMSWQGSSRTCSWTWGNWSCCVSSWTDGWME